MQLRRTLATSLVTGAQIEFLEFEANGSDHVVAEDDARVDVPRNVRLAVLQRIFFGPRPVAGEIEMRQ